VSQLQDFGGGPKFSEKTRSLVGLKLGSEVSPRLEADGKNYSQ
jgi:hypothetical protein